MSKEYVLGFAFSEDRSKWAGIVKDRPDWLKGLINGLGGKVEDKDCMVNQDTGMDRFEHAIMREFNEESGVLIESWELFVTLVFPNDIMGGEAIVKCFRAFTDDIFNCQTKESEQIVIMNTGEYDHPMTANIPMLISMALNKTLVYGSLKMI